MENKGITGSTLKIIAIVTMLIDHVGAVVFERMLENGGIFISILYLVTRVIGRIAFPIFCFLLVEGFIHTRSKKNYALRLLGFAIISEVPFDLATKGHILNFGYQNVFFTLLIGFLAMWAWELAEKKYGEGEQRTLYGMYTVVTILACALAHFMRTDYSLFGVFAILMMYNYREEKVKGLLFGTVILIINSYLEVFALINIIFVRKYNGERGLSLKYVFYMFYPAHLLILYAIAYFMGIVA